MRSALPATRQAAGAPSAWSQPPQSTHSRPRRWCDAGSPGRQCVTAAQKAGANRTPQPGIPPSPTVPHSLGYAQTASTSLTDRLEARPHNVRQAWCGPGTKADQATRKTAPHRGAGHGFVPDEPHGGASRSAQGPCRAPPGRAMRSALPATRQAAGAPSAWSQPPQSTYARPRRWCDAGSPGRQCVTAAQKAGANRTPQPGIPPSPTVPHSLGYAQPASTSLTDRLEARPHNVRQAWCGPGTKADQATRKTAPHRGAGHGFVPDEPHGGASRSAQGPCRAPPGRAMRSALPATRQAAGAPSAWSQPSPVNPRATTPMVRRWVAGTPMRHGGPEGR